MTSYVGPHPDGVCAGCGERLIRVAADDVRHPWCEAPTGDVDEVCALLALAASGVAAGVIEGTAQEKAAVHLGRMLGREPGTVVLSCRGREATYRWPEDWQRAVRDYARGVPLGGVEVRRQAADSTGGVR
jgi:hypothetical protein